MQYEEEWHRAMECVKESMIRDGLSREFVDSMDHKSFDELYPEMIRFYKTRARMIIAMQPLRYEFIGLARTKIL